MKTLRFEGAGNPDADWSRETVGNCRIRTAFHTEDGRRIFLEIGCGGTSHANLRYPGYVYRCHEITGDPDDACKNSLMHAFRDRIVIEMPARTWPYPEPMKTRISMSVRRFPYDIAGILRIVRFLGGDFNSIYVDNSPTGYHVFDARGGYNFGDEYEKKVKR